MNEERVNELMQPDNEGPTNADETNEWLMNELRSRVRGNWRWINEVRVEKRKAQFMPQFNLHFIPLRRCGIEVNWMQAMNEESERSISVNLHSFSETNELIDEMWRDG